MPRLFFDISDSYAARFHCLASRYPQGKRSGNCHLAGFTANRIIGGKGTSMESFIMEYQSNGNTLQSGGSTSTTVIDWDEFRKHAKVGDTIQESSRTLTIYDKAYELTNSGQHFVVHIYAQ
nr:MULTISPECIES: hypothetical protein [Pseudomonas]